MTNSPTLLPSPLVPLIPLAHLRRALIIKLRHHGDVLLSSPVFSVLKHHAPQLDIDALVYADTAPMLSLHPAISQMHTINRAWKHQGLRTHIQQEWGLFQALRSRKYDLLIHLTDHPRGAWLCRALHVPYSVAPTKSKQGKLWQRSFTHLYAKPSNAHRHIVERNLDALRRIGIQAAPDQRSLILIPGADANASIQATLRAHDLKPKGFIHIHPASRWLFKCWPNSKNAELIAQLAAAGEKIVFTAAPDPAEISMVRDIIAKSGVSAINLAGKLSLKELAALSGQAKLFIGVDSAPMHIAAAMGTPCIALFGPSGELEWHPWGVPYQVVASTHHPCRPCGIDGCGGSKISECLTSLPVAQVLAAVKTLLQIAH